ncbi:hypothetical protein GCM10009629_09300 [Pseudonocardia alni]
MTAPGYIGVSAGELRVTTRLAGQQGRGPADPTGPVTGRREASPPARAGAAPTTRSAGFTSRCSRPAACAGVQGVRGAHLPPEPLDDDRVPGEVGGQHRQRDLAAVAAVVGPQHDPHPPAPSRPRISKSPSTAPTARSSSMTPPLPRRVTVLPAGGVPSIRSATQIWPRAAP